MRIFTQNGEYMITANTLKQIHLNDLKKALKELKSATKPQLAAYTGLSVVTINSLIQILLEKHEILEEKDTQINGGRPAAVYSLDRSRKLALLFGTIEHNGEDFITASVIDICGEPTEPFQRFTELSLDNLDISVNYYLQKYPAIQLIAFALPAKEYRGKIIFCDYPAFNNFPLRQYLMNKYERPVYIENDIRIALLGHFFLNNHLKTRTIAGIYFPKKYATGVGLVVNGDILNGNTGVAAEIEYLPEFVNSDWRHRTPQQTLDLIKTVCIMYNPDKLILYDAFMTEEQFSQIQDAFTRDNYQYFRPDFILSSNIQKDYFYGLEQFALLHLDPAVSSFTVRQQ